MFSLLIGHLTAIVVTAVTDFHVSARVDLETLNPCSYNFLLQSFPFFSDTILWKFSGVRNQVIGRSLTRSTTNWINCCLKLQRTIISIVEMSELIKWNTNSRIVVSTLQRRETIKSFAFEFHAAVIRPSTRSSLLINPDTTCQAQANLNQGITFTLKMGKGLTKSDRRRKKMSWRSHKLRTRCSAGNTCRFT
jgi:hypothetical protein